MRKKSVLTNQDAHAMMAACLAEAQKHGWKVSIAILDDAGFPLLLERMDGVGRMSARVAMGKAETAALSGRPSKFWEDRIKERAAFLTFPAAVMVQGALPIIHDGDCIGAIGVSGVQSQEDEQIAQAGIDALR